MKKVLSTSLLVSSLLLSVVSSAADADLHRRDVQVQNQNGDCAAQIEQPAVEVAQPGVMKRLGSFWNKRSKFEKVAIVGAGLLTGYLVCSYLTPVVAEAVECCSSWSAPVDEFGYFTHDVFKKANALTSPWVYKPLDPGGCGTGCQARGLQWCYNALKQHRPWPFDYLKGDFR